MDNTNAERQRRYIARLKAAAARGVSNAPDQRVAALEAELAQAKAHITALEKFLADARKAISVARRQQPAAPKPVKTALPPDEERDRIIKGLKTRVRNLTAELRMAREWNEIAKNRGMSFATRTTIMKAFHPDLPASEKAAAYDAALKAMTAWLASLSRGRT